MGLSGVALLAYTFFVTDTALIVALGSLFTLLPCLLKRFGIDL